MLIVSRFTQQGVVRVVFSRSRSNLLIKAWDAECFLQDASCGHLMLMLGARCLKMHGRWFTVMMQENLSSKRQHFIPVLLLLTFVILSKTAKAKAEWNMMSLPWAFQNTLEKFFVLKMNYSVLQCKREGFFSFGLEMGNINFFFFFFCFSVLAF